MEQHIDEVRTHMRKLEADFKLSKTCKTGKTRAASKTAVVKPIPVSFLGSFDMVFD
jgi:hypothetical protein